MVTRAPRERRLSLDRNIERLREQLDQLASYLRQAQNHPQPGRVRFGNRALDQRYPGRELRIAGRVRVRAVGEAAGLVNMTDEAPESTGLDGERQALLQRSRVLESCIAEVEARRAAGTKGVKGKLRRR